MPPTRTPLESARCKCGHWTHEHPGDPDPGACSMPGCRCTGFRLWICEPCVASQPRERRDGEQRQGRPKPMVSWSTQIADVFSTDAANASREIGEEFIKNDRQAKETYEALTMRGLKHGEARNEIARALLAVTWAVGNGHADSTKADEQCPYPALRRIAAGESAVTVYHADWRGEPV